MILHEVLTTEKVPFTYRVAGIGSRFLAWLVDFMLLIVLIVAGTSYIGILDSAQQGLGSAVGFIWMFCVLWGYFFLFEWMWHGQTMGKRLLGIRVIQVSGTSATWFQAAVRNIVRFADALPPLLGLFGFYGLGFIVAANNSKQRRLGDWAAGTLVVHVERRAKPIRALQEAYETGLEKEALVRTRLNQLTKDQKQTLLDLSLRRDQLRISDRAQLFQALAQYFEGHLGIGPEEHQSAEKFVMQLIGMLG